MIEDKLQSGSFRGASFLFQEVGKTTGRKSVFHTFPNSDIVLAEDLGRQPQSLRLKMIIHGIGDDYFSKRGALETALETKGQGVLVHPTRGTLNVQIDGTYTLNETIGTLGNTVFEATFIIVDDQEFLPTAFSSASVLSEYTKGIQSSLVTLINSAIKITNSVSFTTVKGLTDSLLTNISDNALGLILDEEQLQITKKLINSISTNFSSIIDGQYGTAINSIFTALNDNISDSNAGLTFFQTLFDFGDNAAIITPLTRQLTEAATLQDAVVLNTQIQALVNAVNASSLIDYQTDVELNEVSDAIYTQFDKMTNGNNLSGELIAGLRDQLVEFNKYINDQIVQVLKVTEIDVRNESLTSLVYRYYGNLDNYEVIKNLNQQINLSSLNGTVKILTK